MTKRYNFFLAGESGMGIDSSGEIIIHALAKLGYWVTADREFPSLIKGGESLFSVRFADVPVRASSKIYDFGVAMGKTGLTCALQHLGSGSTLFHNFERREEAFPDLQKTVNEAGIELIYIPTRELLDEMQVHLIFENTLMIGAVASFLHISLEDITEALHSRYGKKQHIWETNKACLETGYGLVNKNIIEEHATQVDSIGQRILVDGNTALALGAIEAGMRCYYSYPMSPSSSILGYIAKTAETTGVVVKQVEDEISALQMNIGSMYAGARALTATSGGGFDLMTETLSLSGMIEVPLVVVIAQRPGPATGLPTWTAQGDLQLAIYGGHGEFARIVLAVSDQQTAFQLIQHAFNLAEQFQVPVVVLTEKVIAENRRIVELFHTGTIDIERGLVSEADELSSLVSSERYAITDSGVSKRRLPGTTTATYFCNGDEHGPDGSLDESEAAGMMIQKRITKVDTIRQILPDPVLYGPAQADISFIGRGSTKNVMVDIIDIYAEQDISVNYLHIEYLRPLKTEMLQGFMHDAKHVCVVEGNATGQLHQLLQKELGQKIKHTLLKRNGRPFYIEDVQDYIEKNI